MSAINIQETIKRNSEMPEQMIKFAQEVFYTPATTTNETGISIYISQYLDSLNISYEIDISGNIIITKGESKNYPCFVAHLDTVHDYSNGFNIMLTKDRNNLIAYDNNGQRVGSGGDDRNGIFVCLYLLSVVNNIKVVIFSREETGGIGSGEIDLSFFKDCSFIASIDRWGNSDFISDYSGDKTCSDDFLEATKGIFDRYGYKQASGYFTDAFNLMNRKVGISCMNLSCGYYQHHSDQEYTCLSELWACCLLSTELCKQATQNYTHTPSRPKLYIESDTSYNWNDINIYDDLTDDEYITLILGEYGIYTDNPVSSIASLDEYTQKDILEAFHTDKGYSYIGGLNQNQNNEK